jgi:hypothetical protein
MGRRHIHIPAQLSQECLGTHHGECCLLWIHAALDGRRFCISVVLGCALQSRDAEAVCCWKNLSCCRTVVWC